MTSTARRARALQLHAALRDLTVIVESCEVECGAVAIPSYPDGARPTSTVRVHGDGCVGAGEHVGWSAQAHQEFRARAPAVLRAGRSSFGALSDGLRAPLAEPYERAALEAALIDLALRQHGVSVFEVAGVAPTAVRYVLSFAPLADFDAALAAALEREGASEQSVELKLDVDPDWSEATLAALALRARAGRVAVLDFKGGGTTAAAARIARAVPEPLLEDPPDPPALVRAHPELAHRLSADAPLTRSAQIAALAPRLAAANVKPARMGGMLEAIATVAECAARDVAVYFGGMWEVGVGRAALLQLASLLSPDGPNDIAPLAAPARDAVVARRPPLLEPASGPGLIGVATRLRARTI